MELREFIESYREAFGEKAQLPLLFGYSDTPVAQTAKIGSCFFKGLREARVFPVRQPRLGKSQGKDGFSPNLASVR